MKSRIISLLGAIAITAGAFLAAAMLPSGQAVFAANEKTVASSQADNTSYLVKSYEGKIGVFQEGSTTPEQIIDFKPESLPQAVQDKLAEGIRVKNRDELLSLLENYTS